MELFIFSELARGSYRVNICFNDEWIIMGGKITNDIVIICKIKY